MDTVNFIQFVYIKLNNNIDAHTYVISVLHRDE